MSEFWGEGMVVYAIPPTPAHHELVGKDPKSKGWPSNPSMYGVAKLLTLVCRTAEGEKFFTQPIKDIPRLLKMPMPVFERLSGLINVEIGEEELEKN